MKSKWVWLPPLFYYQAMPFFLVTVVSSVFFKHFELENRWIALLTSVFYFPWVVKALGGPFVQRFMSLKRWLFHTQVWIAVLTLGLAFAATAPSVQLKIIWMCVVFMGIALLGMFHDIAAEGLYIAGLTEKEQTFFIGVRATFFRLGWLSMQGLFVAYIGTLERQKVPLAQVWFKGYVILTIVFAAFAILNRVTLPDPKQASQLSAVSRKASYFQIIRSFFEQKDIGPIFCFLAFFRIAEAQLQKLAIPFFLDPRTKGGLGLMTDQVGILYGSLGPFSLSLGGLLGGWVVSRSNLKRWIMPMAFAINIPHLLYVYLAYAQPENLYLIGACVNIEQFFYGFSFTAYLLFMIETSKGAHATTNYAVATGLMALGMMLPGSWSGILQEKLGYPHFFVWVLICTVPSVWATSYGSRKLTRDLKNKR